LVFQIQDIAYVKKTNLIKIGVVKKKKMFFVRKMIFYPNAKINIGLNIISKRKDGYHNLNSIFYPIFNVYDILEIIKSKKFEFTTSGLAIDCTADKNLCYKVYTYFKEKYDIQNIKVHLHKNIPIGSGLGGGSSDAAFTIKAINNLFQLGLNINELESISAKIGSDCPFFISNKPKYVTGTGDILSDIDLNLSNYNIQIYTPKIKISTRDAFDKILPNQNNEGKIIENITKPMHLWKNYIHNDFERLHNVKSKIIKIRQTAYDSGAIYASMTGTGSAVYAIFEKN
tara:strand:- start:1006 stop:1860 length:855 start_codon:yes stop_codon:yes gene_type:complete